ncbi:MAG TPA: glycosyltransferase [Caldilineaceae bacterium]|nr:glycosyltransferase [Caldilineaceae bacterium]
MSIVYLLPMLPSVHPDCEAISQEIALLRSRFDGAVIHVNPNGRSPLPLPRLAFGLTQLPDLRRQDDRVLLYHFYNPDPFPFPFLLALRRPVVYTIASGVEKRRPNLAFLRRMAVVTVPDARSLAQLQGWGLKNCLLQRPGIDTSRFTHSPQPLGPGEPCRLVVASAPWTEAQFASKGFDTLLATAERTPDLHLTLLWRGVLVDELRARLRIHRLETRVEVIDGPADMNKVLARAHATALLATKPGIVKSFPHSLLDSLAAGKPVLVSRAIPMADYVAETGCGVVIDEVTPAAVLAGLAMLRAGYDGYRRAAEMVGQRDFSPAAALDSAAAIYQAAQSWSAHSGRSA